MSGIALVTVFVFAAAACLGAWSTTRDRRATDRALASVDTLIVDTTRTLARTDRSLAETWDRLAASAQARGDHADAARFRQSAEARRVDAA